MRQFSFQKGFTLIELMVTMSISVVIMSVVIFSYSKFNDRLALTSSAQEIAITIRQAQANGVNVKESKVGTGQFVSGYGIFFNPARTGYAGDPTHYTVFVDTNANNVYDTGNGCGSSSTECVETGTIRGGVTVFAVCNSTNNCSTDVVSLFASMTIMFIRPNPDATMNFITSSGAVQSNIGSGRILLKSPQGSQLNVVVQSTGQVSIQ